MTPDAIINKIDVVTQTNQFAMSVRGDALYTNEILFSTHLESSTHTMIFGQLFCISPQF